MSRLEGILEYAKSNVTKTVQKDVYPAIDPTRAELSQTGKTILITGGGDNLGLSIGKAFVQADAETIIIVGRRLGVLEDAKCSLDKEAKDLGKNTKVIACPSDLADLKKIDELWKHFDQQGLPIDVYIQNSAKPPQPTPVLEDPDDIWSQVEVNARGPLYMTKRFSSQNEGKPKFIVNISSAVVHSYQHPAVAARPGTVLSKTTNTLLFQLIAQHNAPEELQVISVNPGLLYNQYMKSLDLPEEQFDKRELAAAFCVWASTKAAAFLHGRFVWASWCVEELASGELRRKIDEDPYFLRTSVMPLRAGYVS